jgi:ribosome maturation factor RimP
MENRERELFDLLEKVVAARGLDLVEVRLGSGRSRALLTIVIHSREGVTHGDCARVTEACERALAGDPAGRGPHTIEVSSPGTDRVLRAAREFELFRGRRVLIRTAPDFPEREICGTCAGFREGAGICLRTEDGREIVVPWDSVVKARLVPEGPLSGRRPDGGRSVTARPVAGRRHPDRGVGGEGR